MYSLGMGRLANVLTIKTLHSGDFLHAGLERVGLGGMEKIPVPRSIVVSRIELPRSAVDFPD